MSHVPISCVSHQCERRAESGERKARARAATGKRTRALSGREGATEREGVLPGRAAEGAAEDVLRRVEIPGGEHSTAQVIQVGAKQCVPFDCFDDVLVADAKTNAILFQRFDSTPRVRDVGAIPEMLGYGEGGFLISPGDRTALSGALDRLLVSPAVVRAQGRRNRQVAARDYTMAVVERKLEDLYREVAGWPAAEPSGTARGVTAAPESNGEARSPFRPGMKP